MQISEHILNDLKKDIGEKRFLHSIRTAEYAVKLAKIWGLDEEKAYTAGLFHDCAKYKDFDLLHDAANKHECLSEFMGRNCKDVLHAKYGVILAKEKYNIKDDDILNAISFHATGRPAMSKLEKILLVSDKVELGRKYEGVEELRKQAENNLDDAIAEILSDTIHTLIYSKKFVVEDTFSAYNYYIKWW